MPVALHRDDPGRDRVAPHAALHRTPRGPRSTAAAVERQPGVLVALVALVVPADLPRKARRDHPHPG
ncbi:hypothetical protein ACIPLC_17445 [Kitasatospora sp. NPDC086801]|uniref:hypothetical protein n=1 Tax=Kitasatospora sp. NPDC086801 TaxID=3364066 RepID=UPI0037F4DFCC